MVDQPVTRHFYAVPSAANKLPKVLPGGVSGWILDYAGIDSVLAVHAKPEDGRAYRDSRLEKTKTNSSRRPTHGPLPALAR